MMLSIPRYKSSRSTSITTARMRVRTRSARMRGTRALMLGAQCPEDLGLGCSSFGKDSVIGHDSRRLSQFIAKAARVCEALLDDAQQQRMPNGNASTTVSTSALSSSTVRLAHSLLVGDRTINALIFNAAQQHLLTVGYSPRRHGRSSASASDNNSEYDLDSR